MTIDRQPLPDGYSAGAAWGFHDPAGLSYEFFRVYGRTHGSGDRELVSMDEGRSYWSVALPVREPGHDVRLLQRSISYAEALKVLPARLSFGQFSSPLAMYEVLPHLFEPRS